MDKREALHTPVGEMLDLIDCHAIANGAVPKYKNSVSNYDDAIQVR